MPLRLHICKQETRRAIETSRAFTNKWRHLFSLQSSLLIFATTPLPLRSSHSTPAPSQPRLDFIAMRLGRVSQSWEDSVPVTCGIVVINNAHSQLCHQTISTRRERSQLRGNASFTRPACKAPNSVLRHTLPCTHAGPTGGPTRMGTDTQAEAFSRDRQAGEHHLGRLRARKAPDAVVD